MARKRFVLLLALTLLAVSFMAASPARANTIGLSIHRRACGYVSAYAVYDGFSEGTPQYYVAFTVDLNGNGIFGEAAAGEPTRVETVMPGGQAIQIGMVLRFKALPEGSIIAVTAYEVDNMGVPVSPQLEPIKYRCFHRPATNKLSHNTGVPDPELQVTIRVSAPVLPVYAAPTAKSARIGGLAYGVFTDVYARNQRGDWFQIRHRGKTGWVMWNSQAIPFGPYSTLPVLPDAESYTAIPPTATP